MTTISIGEEMDLDKTMVKARGTLIDRITTQLQLSLNILEKIV